MSEYDNNEQQPESEQPEQSTLGAGSLWLFLLFAYWVVYMVMTYIY